jgi:O-antigen/teichoic acid export membrane protein
VSVRSLRAVRQSGLVRNTAWAGASEFCRAAAGTVSFVLLARAMGPSAFGRYAGTLALIWTLMPFATLGRPHLIILQVSRDPQSFRRAWSDALVGTFFGGCAATAMVMGLRLVFLPSVPLQVIFLLAISEFLGSAIGEAAAGAAQATDRLSVCAMVRIFFAIIRLAAAAAFFLLGRHGLAAFPIFQLTACAIGAVVSAVIISAICGAPSRLKRPTFRSLSSGLPFSFSTASFMMQDGIDKTILVRSGLALQAGPYAAAYRFVSMVMLPINALLQATYSRFFRAGADGLASAWRLGRRLLAPASAYGVVVALGAVAFAPLLAVVLGGEYQGAVPMIRALAFLPLVRILQYFPANALTGSGYQKTRTACQATTAVLTVILCFALIPPMGWIGAVLATLVAEILFAGAVWTALVVLLRKEARLVVASAPGDERLMKVA